MKLGAEWRKDRFKLGGHFLLDFLHSGLHGSIDGGNICIEVFHFLLGLSVTRLQGIEASFQVLAISIGHEDEGTEKRRVGSKTFLKNDMYECDKGEEMKPMG